MDFLESTFEIVKSQDCPFYNTGDKFNLTGRSIFLLGKPTCLTLMSDVTEALVKCQSLSRPQEHKDEHLFVCSGYLSGCEGKIQVRYAKAQKTTEETANQPMSGENSIARELINFSIFKSMSESEIYEFSSYLKIKDFRSNEIILRKGDRGEKLFVILSGSIEIIGDYGVSIATLGKGEVFGEMSLLTGSPVSAKVRAVEDTKVVYMPGNYFRLMLNRFSPLQMYFTRLLAKRLSQSNLDRSREVSAGMAGNLSEISALELLQALNMSQKTGILTLKLAKGTARILLKDGEITGARYDDWSGKDAFFGVLKEKRGEFKFKPGLQQKDMAAPAIGGFMYLMMEGTRQIDEASESMDEGPEEMDGF